MPEANTQIKNLEADMSHKLGKLEGRMDSFDSRFNKFEQNIEERLSGIEDKLGTLIETYFGGRGIKMFLGAVGGTIVVVASALVIWQFFH